MNAMVSKHKAGLALGLILGLRNCAVGHGSMR